jgi:hypothetical protein
MPKPKPDRDPGRCACGRLLADAAAFNYRTPDRRVTFRRCKCGLEWTEGGRIRAGEPISVDEMIELHERLKEFEGSFKELLLDSRRQPGNPAAGP